MRNYILGAWEIADPVYHKLRNFTTIETKDKFPVLRVQLIRYRGPEHTLSNGELIKKGDYLIKIHLHNIRLIKYLEKVVSPTRKTLLLYQMVKNALPGLAQFIKNHQLNQRIKGICGVTMLNKLVERLGFEIKPISNTYYRLLKCCSQIPIHFLSTGRFTGVFDRTRVNYLFMSKNKLLELA
ncbi:YkoP family protein [Evansella tamaricis]|uniref:YkoP-like domain-containing protein n=1 Tax=Evansella tamaricis TaxID=2069301 RepID=A0ABS6JFY8_9BACI|nr:hypothetical protein [Evansella tamaricis]MBU9712585.1 hypothetical protein [Evansella tamaricis]